MNGLYLIMYFTLIDIVNTLVSPFFIAIFLIIIYQYYNLNKSDYGLSINKKSALSKAINSSLYGIFGGFLSTIAFIYLEVVIVPKDFMYILTTAIVLSLINPRFMCFAYGGSILSLFSLVFNFPKIETKDIMLVVATLHIVESLLIFLNGYKGKIPVFYEHKGEYVGGFNINRFWPIPFVIFVGDGLIKPMTLMAILAYGDFTTSYPRRKTIITSIVLLAYSFILLSLTKANINPLIPPIFALIGHEFILSSNEIMEKKKSPVFTTTLNGVRVMEVAKNGIAKDIGIETGDVILSINEAIIKDEKDIAEIESLDNSILKIHYFNRKKGLTTKNYRGNKKTLGVSIVPRVMY